MTRARGRAWAIGAAGAAAVLALACGDDGPGTGPPPSQGTAVYTITIRNMAFSPLNLRVPPGATVTVVNQDSVLHSVTSEATAGAFTPGGVAGVSFDTRLFTGTTTFAIPASAPDGTVVPYYCTSHGGTMTTPNGTITVSVGAGVDGGTLPTVPTLPTTPNDPGGGY